MTMVRAVAVAAVISAATAAGTVAQPVIGFRLGLSMSKASTEFSDPDLAGLDESWLTAFAGGGFIRFGFGAIAIQPELMYVTKGVKFEDDVSDGELKFKLDYVEVPVLLFLGLGTGTVMPYLVAGPAFGFEASCSIEFELDGTSQDDDCDEGEVDRKKIDVGAMAGAGLAFPAGPGSIVIDARYNHGLINIVDDETSDDSFKHRSFYFTAGYQIPLGIR